MLPSYRDCLALLAQRLDEPAPGRIQLLAGPRQVGKTTLLLELRDRLGQQVVYAAADAPEASLPGFFERIWSRTEEVAAREGHATVLLDEVHLLPDWAARLKGVWDRLRRNKVPVHVVATGSSALRIGVGSKESLAGRFERITLTHWSAASLVREFKLGSREATDTIVKLGSYPGTMGLRRDLRRWSAYVRDAIIEPAIGRDIVAMAAVRKPALLRQVFGVAVSSPAQIVALKKFQGQLQDAGSLDTIAQYLRLLEDALLVASLPKYSARVIRQRAAPPKLVVLNNALLAALSADGTPDPASDPARHGSWVENACLAHAWNSDQQVWYWREEPYEVDAVIEGSFGAWAVEVKTGGYSLRDLRGLFEFVRRFPRFKPMVLCDDKRESVAEQAGAVARPWREFLLRGTA